MSNYRPRVPGPLLASVELNCSIRSNQKRTAYLAEFIAQLGELNRMQERVKLATLSAQDMRPAPKNTLQ